MGNPNYEIVVDDKPAVKDIAISVLDCEVVPTSAIQLELFNISKAVGAPIDLMDEALPEEKEVEEKK